MQDKKYYIALDDFERRVVVNCMNKMRNSFIDDGKCTEELDEVLLKLSAQNKRNLKLYIRRHNYGTISKIHYRRKNRTRI